MKGIFTQAIGKLSFLQRALNLYLQLSGMVLTTITHSTTAALEPGATVFQPTQLCLNQSTNDQIHSF